MNNYNCKYCGKQWNTNQSRNGHQTNCKLNPDIDQIRYKISLSLKNKKSNQKLKKQIYSLQCAKCGKKFQLQLTQHLYNSGKYRKHCSRACANSRIWTEQDKLKKSIANKKNPSMYQLNCNNCGILFNSKSKSKKYCSTKCKTIKTRGWHFKMKPGHKAGGLRDGGGHSKVYQYINNMNEIMYLNKEQMLVAKILDDSHLIWHRNKIGFSYVDLHGRERKYYPDFYIQDLLLFVQYKGFITEQMSHKMKEAKCNHNLNLLIVVNSDRYANCGIQLNKLNTYLLGCIG